MQIHVSVIVLVPYLNKEVDGTIMQVNLDQGKEFFAQDMQNVAFTKKIIASAGKQKPFINQRRLKFGIILRVRKWRAWDGVHNKNKEYF